MRCECCSGSNSKRWGLVGRGSRQEDEGRVERGKGHVSTSRRIDKAVRPSSAGQTEPQESLEDAHLMCLAIVNELRDEVERSAHVEQERKRRVERGRT